jgi:hypothetical protein
MQGFKLVEESFWRDGPELARHTEKELGRIQARKSQITSVNSNIPRKNQKGPTIQISRFS